MVERTCCAHIIFNRKRDGRMFISDDIVFSWSRVWARIKLLFSLIGGFMCRELVFDLVASRSVAQMAVRAHRSVKVFCLREPLMSTLTKDRQKLCTHF